MILFVFHVGIRDIQNLNKFQLENGFDSMQALVKASRAKVEQSKAVKCAT